MNQEQDEVLLERIKQLESENRQLKVPKKSFSAWLIGKVDTAFELAPPILIGGAILSALAAPIIGAALEKDTGNFYEKYTRGTTYIYQEVDWGQDRVVWEGNASPEQVAARVKEFRDSWRKARE